MKCMNCNKENDSKSKYCSDKCKVAYHRNKNRNKNRNTVTAKTVTDVTIPDRNTLPVTDALRPANYGQPDCECMMCTINSNKKRKLTINHDAHKHAGSLQIDEVNRVAIPGDVDYNGAVQC